MALSCEARSGRETGDRERETLGARHEGIQLKIFVGRMRLAADRPDRADGRAADARREAGIGTAARELALDRQADRGHGLAVAVEELAGGLVLDERVELALDRERRVGARYGRGSDDVLDHRHGDRALRRL